MKSLLALALLFFSITALAQDEAQIKAMDRRLVKAQEYMAKGYYPLDCFAGQVRVRGKRLARQSFAVFRPNAEMKCCGEKIANGRTDAHAHFLVEPLSEGEYFAQFESKDTAYTVSFAVIQDYPKCGTQHVELNFSGENQCRVQEYEDVDFDEKECSADDPACYRK